MSSEAMTSKAVDAALAVLGPLARSCHPLAPLTTYRVGGAAAVFVEARTVEHLGAVARAHRASGLPVLVVGRGSNLLVADEGFVGIAVSIAALGDELAIPDDCEGPHVTVEVAGGASLPVIARRTAAAGLTGFEWAVGVPGSIGGAVRMNAGGHGSDMAACVVDVDIVDLASNEERPSEEHVGIERRGVDRLGLGFRSSELRDADVVVSARLALRPGDRTQAEHQIAEIVRWRRAHQPGGQNCGSVFVNPVPGEVAAGALIDALGLRGLRIGTASVSDKHANFIQADDGGTARDVRAVMETVRRRVADATGYLLRSEVRLVGFADGEVADSANEVVADDAHDDAGAGGGRR